MTRGQGLSTSIAFLVTLLGSPGARAESPSLTGASPSAAVPGDITEVVFRGAGLRDVTGLWTSFQSEVVLVGEEDDGGSARFWIKVPAGEPVGIGGVRIATRRGISSLFLFMIDDLRGVAGLPGVDSPGSERPIAVPGAFDGVIGEQGVDRYRLAGLAGDRVSIDVVARRLGSPLDPLLRVLDAEGREIAYCDDERGSGADPRLSLALERAGEYVIELRDVTYRGGEPFRYRLRVGDFPLATVPFPLAAPPGRVTCRMLGPWVEGLPPLEIELREGGLGVRDVVPIDAAFPGGNASGFAVMATSDLDERFEKEPNDVTERATRVELPGALNGRFTAKGDRDVYAFRAREGERLVFAGRTRRLGSPADLVLRLERQDGSRLAEVEDSGPDEGSVDHAFAEDGVCFLVVEDLLLRGGPDFAYRVEVRRHVPDFALRLESETLEAPEGGEFEVEVACERKGYDGPIEIGLEGDGGVIELEDAVIAKSKKETTLRGRLPPSWGPGTLRTVRFTGVARLGKEDVRREASTAPALEKLFPRLRHPPPLLDGLVGIGVVAREEKAEEK